jgi:hypothetical protein
MTRQSSIQDTHSTSPSRDHLKYKHGSALLLTKPIDEKHSRGGTGTSTVLYSSVGVRYTDSSSAYSIRSIYIVKCFGIK